MFPRSTAARLSHADQTAAPTAASVPPAATICAMSVASSPESRTARSFFPAAAGRSEPHVRLQPGATRRPTTIATTPERVAIIGPDRPHPPWSRPSRRRHAERATARIAPYYLDTVVGASSRGRVACTKSPVRARLAPPHETPAPAGASASCPLTMQRNRRGVRARHRRGVTRFELPPRRCVDVMARHACGGSQETRRGPLGGSGSSRRPTRPIMKAS